VEEIIQSRQECIRRWRHVVRRTKHLHRHRGCSPTRRVGLGLGIRRMDWCPWTPRRRATCVETAGGKVILMSGKSSAENPDDDVILTDAWASSDSGRTWVCLSKYMSFGVMYNIGFAAVLHGRAILIVGGHSYGDVFEFEEDVWETDGDKSSQRALASASAVS
jgi:hypothetical protein